MIEDKTLWAVDHVSNGRGKVLEPGEKVSGVSADVARSMLERGLVSDSQQAAKRAASQEAERRAHVQQQVAGRAERDT